MPQNPDPLLTERTVWEELEPLVAAKLIASPDAELKAELERTPIGHLGAGSRRVLAAYLLAARRPSVLALDEPTAGLDRRNARLIGSLVREAASRGSLVLVSSHDESFVESVSDRVFRVEGGSLSSELLKVRRSRIHPLAASVAVALIASSITLEQEVLGSLPVMATSLVLALLTVRRASLIAVWALRFLPMGLGLGTFAFLASGGKQIELVPLLLVRVETMVMGSMLLAYGVESWELAYSLRSLGLPGWFSSSIGIAHVLLRRSLRALDEVIAALRSKGLIASPLHQLTRVGVITRALVAESLSSAEKVSLALEARGFDPEEWRPIRPVPFRFWDLLAIAVAASVFLISALL
jgi:energy-coupling factor transporter transmembrane protein EcfT